MKFRLNLRTRFTLVYTVIALILVGIIALYSYARYEEILYKQAFDSYEQSAVQMQQNIEYKLSVVQYVSDQVLSDQTVERILTTQQLRGDVSYTRLENMQALEQALDSALFGTELVSRVYIYTNNPCVPSDGSYLFSEENIADTMWHRQFLAQSVQSLWKRKEDGYFNRDTRLQLIKPITFQDATSLKAPPRWGTLVIEFPVDEILKVLRQVEVPGAKTELCGTSLYLSPHQEVEIDDNEKNIIIQKRIEDTDLMLNVYVPYSYINRNIFEINRELLLIALVATLLSVVVIALATNVMTRRIYQLKNKMRLIQENKTELLYNLRGSDEIVELDEGLNDMVFQLRKLLRDLYQSEAKKKEAELRFLQMQINPHFLYNTLDSIKSCVDLGHNDNAVQMLIALKNYFRISLGRGLDVIRIEDEIRHSSAYIQIQQFRTDNEFVVDWQIPEQMKSYRIMKTILQPIIENSLQHGFGPIAYAGKITIRGGFYNDYLYLCVFDNGIGMDCDTLAALRQNLYDPDVKQSVGLKNVVERLKNYYGDSCAFRVYSVPQQGTFTVIRIEKNMLDES